MKTLKISAILHGGQNLVPGSSQHNGGARSNTAFTGSLRLRRRHLGTILSKRSISGCSYDVTTPKLLLLCDLCYLNPSLVNVRSRFSSLIQVKSVVR